MRPSKNLENKTPSEIYRRVQQLCIKVQAFDELRFIMAFLTNLGVTEILCGFRLVLEGKTGKEIPESSRLEFLEKFSAIFFYQMQKTTPLGCWIEEV